MSIEYPVHNAVAPASSKRTNASTATQGCYNSIPATKRSRLSSASQTDSDGTWNSGMMNLRPSHTLSSTIGESSRLNNIRFVSVTSMHLALDRGASVSRESNISSHANYFSSSSNDFPKKKQINEPIQNTDLLAANIVNGSWSTSSVASITQIRETIQVLNNVTGTDMQSQLIVADQFYHLATWTKTNSLSFLQNDPRPTSTANLTLHQAALAIVSCNGINVVLSAMNEHPNNIEVQENGCMVLGNVLAILYHRKAGKSIALERYLSENTIQMGNAIFNQIIRTMQHHPVSIAVNCAAIPALQYYYLSVLAFRPNDAMSECEDIVLQSAQELLLPSKIRRILSNCTKLSRASKTKYVANCNVNQNS